MTEGIHQRRVCAPVMIGNLRIANRLVRDRHNAGLGSSMFSEECINHHVNNAIGGYGMSILDGGSVHPSSRIAPALYGEAIVPALRRLTAAIAPYGMRLIQQLAHGGNLYPAFDGGVPFSVSRAEGPWGGAGECISANHILELKLAFVSVALQCQEGGIDGVELDASEGSIFHQFLSPAINQRDDDYGSSFENRSRFLFETIRAIRAAAGPDFALGVRFHDEAGSGDIDENDKRRLLEQLESERLIHYVRISMSTSSAPEAAPMALWRTSSELAVPRIVSGNAHTLDEVEMLLREARADLVTMSRS